MGLRCEAAYDPCATSPCLNSATCVKQSEERGAALELTCACLPGYTGQHCEVNIDDCVGVACQAHHLCVDLVQGYECRCPRGYQGDNCTEDIDECGPQPCRNGATCRNLVGEYSCSCPPGYSGLNCTEDVDECTVSPNICNNGICRNTKGTYECYCRPGYSGTHCTHDFNECLSVPCKNGGSCENLVNAYGCTCLPGFNGECFLSYVFSSGKGYEPLICVLQTSYDQLLETCTHCTVPGTFVLHR